MIKDACFLQQVAKDEIRWGKINRTVWFNFVTFILTKSVVGALLNVAVDTVDV